MKTTSFYIRQDEIATFKTSCDSMDVKFISSEMIGVSSSWVTVEYLDEHSLFYLGQHFQLNKQWLENQTKPTSS